MHSDRKKCPHLIKIFQISFPAYSLWHFFLQQNYNYWFCVSKWLLWRVEGFKFYFDSCSFLLSFSCCTATHPYSSSSSWADVWPHKMFISAGCSMFQFVRTLLHSSSINMFNYYGLYFLLHFMSLMITWAIDMLILAYDNWFAHDKYKLINWRHRN